MAMEEAALLGRIRWRDGIEGWFVDVLVLQRGYYNCPSIRHLLNPTFANSRKLYKAPGQLPTVNGISLNEHRPLRQLVILLVSRRSLLVVRRALGSIKYSSLQSHQFHSPSTYFNSQHASP